MSTYQPPSTRSALRLVGWLGQHRSGRDLRGTCPPCGYCDAQVLTERRSRVYGLCASCQDQDFVTLLFRGGDCAEVAQATCAVEAIGTQAREFECRGAA